MVIAASFGLGQTLMALGGSHSALPKARRLVTSGPYKMMRHPLYCFAFLLQVGTLLVIAPKWSWVPCLLVPLQIYRARAEEKVLDSKFGPLWRSYKQSTLF